MEAALLVASGTNPRLEKGAKKAAAAAAVVSAKAAKDDLVENVVPRFLSQYSQRQHRPRTIEECARILTKGIVPAWRGRRLSDISRKDAYKLPDSICEAHGPSVARLALAWGGKLSSWAVEREITTINPFAGVKPPATETPSMPHSSGCWS